MAEYYVDCKNEKCGWSGTLDLDVEEFCPECCDDVEPSNEHPITEKTEQ